ncbi:MAG: hypothetical protein WDN25_04745 [Acetobacteraceae bacterium]
MAMPIACSVSASRARCVGVRRSAARPAAFHLDAGSQFQHVQDRGHSLQPVRIDLEGAASDVAGDEGADTLAGLHESQRLQCGDRFADDGARDTGGR